MTKQLGSNTCIHFLLAVRVHFLPVNLGHIVLKQQSFMKKNTFCPDLQQFNHDKTNLIAIFVL
jgi:hypothetical protein